MNQLSSCFISVRQICWAISKHIVYDEKNMVVLPWIWPGQILVLGPTTCSDFGLARRRALRARRFPSGFAAASGGCSAL